MLTKAAKSFLEQNFITLQLCIQYTKRLRWFRLALQNRA
jgi:hypothetical protein